MSDRGQDDKHKEVLRRLDEVVEKLEVIQANSSDASGYLLVIGGMIFCVGVAVLCLQDAPILSWNSVAPGLMVVLPITTILAIGTISALAKAWGVSEESVPTILFALTIVGVPVFYYIFIR
jgi:hypothetical protein